MITFKTKYILLSRGCFIFSVVGCIASGTLHFTRFFSVRQWLSSGMTTLAFGLASQAQAKIGFLGLSGKRVFGLQKKNQLL